MCCTEPMISFDMDSHRPSRWPSQCNVSLNLGWMYVEVPRLTSHQSRFPSWRHVGLNSWLFCAWKSRSEIMCEWYYTCNNTRNNICDAEYFDWCWARSLGYLSTRMLVEVPRLTLRQSKCPSRRNVSLNSWLFCAWKSKDDVSNAPCNNTRNNICDAEYLAWCWARSLRYLPTRMLVEVPRLTLPQSRYPRRGNISLNSWLYYA